MSPSEEKSIKLQCSRKQIRRAGETLIESGASRKEINEAMDILNVWREVHAYPLAEAEKRIIQHIAEAEIKNTIVARRLKRTPSIIGKLKRFPSMKLERINDIGGCRAVLNTNKQVYELLQLLIDDDQIDIKTVTDYIKKPKESGYRGIHLICKYITENGAILIEIQLRSQVQHAWATSVEVSGTFLRSSLKSSQGDDEWLEFFSRISREFAWLEGSPRKFSLGGNRKRIKELEEQLHVIGKLSAYQVVSDHIRQHNINPKKSAYYLMVLDIYEKKISFSGYSASQIDKASRAYLKLEKERASTGRYDVVLVSTTSMKQLMEAYPNYFGNTEAFLLLLQSVAHGNWFLRHLSKWMFSNIIDKISKR